MKKNQFFAVSLYAAILLIVCFIHVSGEQSVSVYDPWCDLNHDGTIDIFDIVTMVDVYGTSGDPGVGLTNGDFEFGTLDGWEVFPYGRARISTTTVHAGSYSAFVSDDWYNCMMRQPVGLVAPVPVTNLTLEGWVYPLRVGILSAEYPVSGITCRLYNRSTMQPTFTVTYSWCMYKLNISHVYFYLPFNVSEWNHFSRNVTADILAWRPTVGSLEDTVLYSIQAMYHYSNENPGAFYVDDLKIS